MELYIYSDESGVLDKIHNDYYTYGGLIFTTKENRDAYSRKYLSAERKIANAYEKNMELKACRIKNKDKNKLYKVVRPCIKFGSIINQKKLLDQLFDNKKSKQRYLDYAYKIALKHAFQSMSAVGTLNLSEVNKLNIFVDEHTTATNGMYELRESLLQEFKYGTFNMHYNKYYPPIFNNLQDISLQYCNSEKKPLIRAADIVANRLYYAATNHIRIDPKSELYIKWLP